MGDSDRRRSAQEELQRAGEWLFAYIGFLCGTVFGGVTMLFAVWWVNQ